MRWIAANQRQRHAWMLPSLTTSTKRCVSHLSTNINADVNANRKSPEYFKLYPRAPRRARLTRLTPVLLRHVWRLVRGPSSECTVILRFTQAEPISLRVKQCANSPRGGAVDVSRKHGETVSYTSQTVEAPRRCTATFRTAVIQKLTKANLALVEYFS